MSAHAATAACVLLLEQQMLMGEHSLDASMRR
jgi:hypothetical protein